jgi:hypothetical protein
MRRTVHGWFGPPWPSGVCWDDNDRLRTDMRIQVPIGDRCLHCEAPFEPDDSGMAMPCYTTEGPSIRHIHKECNLRMAIGSLAHLEHRCTCYGGTDNATPGLTMREEAQMVWEWWTTGRKV